MTPVFVFSLFLLTLCNGRVIELSDTNFEHDTQASTGGTTGVWFVEFYAPWCQHCRTFEGIWTKVGKELEGLVNVARVDASNNAKLSERFNIRALPHLILLDKGKMYVYKGRMNQVEIQEFALGAFEKSKGVMVPKEVTLFNSLSAKVNSIFDQLHASIVRDPVLTLFIFAWGTFFGIMLSWAVVFCTFRANRKDSKQKKE